jgi:two-component system, LytTR family, sensor kinase
MNHPFFKNLRLLIFYIAVWILVTGIHAAVLFFFYHIPISLSFADGLVFNLLFAFFGLSLWFIVAFSKYNKSPVINGIITHFSSAVLLLLIWVPLGDFIVSIFTGSNAEYDKFLSTSLPWRIISGLFYYSIVVLMYYMINYYNERKEQLAREVRLNEIIRATELDLLKSQINPHFLFNALNSISSLTITNPPRAQEMIIKLSDYLRYSISQGSGSLVSLKDEIENVKRYLEIEKVRFGPRLEQMFNISQNSSDLFLPAMILQPLYENVIKHGVYESTQMIIIETKCFAENNFLRIEISNNFDSQAASRKGTGLGLKNINERLKLIYHQDMLLKTKKVNDCFTVEILIPQNV